MRASPPLLAVVVMLGLAGCGAAEPEAHERLVGAWAGIYEVAPDGQAKAPAVRSLRFERDGAWNGVVSILGEAQIAGRWTIEGDHLVLISTKVDKPERLQLRFEEELLVLREGSHEFVFEPL